MPSGSGVRAATAFAVLGCLGAACGESGAVSDARDGAENPADGSLPSHDGAVRMDEVEDAPIDHMFVTYDVDPADGDAGSTKLHLFNGRDWSGWETYLGPPLGSTEPIGHNKDPKGVFSIVDVDGAPAIRISGEVWGALSTLEEFGDYHLHVEFKWGTHAVWPPLTVRDSGVMYHSMKPFGAVTSGGGVLADPPLSGYFMTSLELQIAQDDVGSCYVLGPVRFDEGAVVKVASAQQENPVGAWNELDVFAVGSESAHAVNGHTVVHLKDATRLAEDGGTMPLTRGRIQLQSESMEIFFRNITLETIGRIPNDLP